MNLEELEVPFQMSGPSNLCVIGMNYNPWIGSVVITGYKHEYKLRKHVTAIWCCNKNMIVSWFIVELWVTV